MFDATIRCRGRGLSSPLFAVIVTRLCYNLMSGPGPVVSLVCRDSNTFMLIASCRDFDASHISPFDTTLMESKLSSSQNHPKCDWTFVDTDQALKCQCTMCFRVQSTVAQMPCCSYTACRTCLLSMKEALCPRCAKPFNDVPAALDEWKSRVEGLVVKCPLRCVWTGPMCDVETRHFETCPELVVPCPLDCGIVGTRAEIGTRHLSVCPNAVIPCPVEG